MPHLRGCFIQTGSVKAAIRQLIAGRTVLQLPPGSSRPASIRPEGDQFRVHFPLHPCLATLSRPQKTAPLPYLSAKCQAHHLHGQDRLNCNLVLGQCMSVALISLYSSLDTLSCCKSPLHHSLAAFLYINKTPNYFATAFPFRCTSHRHICIVLTHSVKRDTFQPSWQLLKIPEPFSEAQQLSYSKCRVALHGVRHLIFTSSFNVHNSNHDFNLK